LATDIGINDRGYWEDAGFVDFNIGLLEAVGHDWHSLALIPDEAWRAPALLKQRLPAVEFLRTRLGHHDVFGLKDPRIGQTLPFWNDVFEHMRLKVGYVVPFRNPANVARSLARLYGFELEKGYLLWYAHMLTTLKGSEQAPRVFVDFDKMLKAPEYQLQRIATGLDLTFDPQGAALCEYKQDFLEASLRHYDYDLDDLKLDLATPKSVIDLSQVILALAHDQRPDDDSIRELTRSRCQDLLQQDRGLDLMRRYDKRATELGEGLKTADAQLSARGEQVSQLEQALGERNEQIDQLKQALQECHEQIGQLEQAIGEHDERINQLEQALGERDEQVCRLEQALQECHEQIGQLDQAIAERDRQVNQLEQAAIARDDTLAALKQAALEDREQISNLEQALTLGAEQLALRERLIGERDIEIGHANMVLARYGGLRVLFKALLQTITQRIGLDYLYASWVFKKHLIRNNLFDPAYYLGTYRDVARAGIDPFKHFMRHGWREARNPSAGFSSQAYLALHGDVRLGGKNPLIHYIRHGHKEGRFIETVSGARMQAPLSRTYGQKLTQLLILLLKRPGLGLTLVKATTRGSLGATARAIIRAAQSAQNGLPAVSSVQPDEDGLPVAEFPSHDYVDPAVVPFYLNPVLSNPPTLKRRDIGVHLHLSRPDLVQDWTRRLAHIPMAFDLFISVPDYCQIDALEQSFATALPNLRDLTIKSVPQKAGAVAAFIIEFGGRLADYHYVAHFDASFSPADLDGGGEQAAAIDRLCGSLSGVQQIFALLQDDARIVYPAALAGHRDIEAQTTQAESVLLDRLPDFDLEALRRIEPIQGMMFWARGACLEAFLAIPARYEEFVGETGGAGIPRQALGRLLAACIGHHKGRSYRLEAAGLTERPSVYCETQNDFSGQIKHTDIKVLAYYLPQFHPTPENDEWHGKGFTEWHKVAAANPLFYGHYQQHVPHPDIGYYHLAAPEDLAQQALLMQKSGVHGMIFYHYWFSGRMILEKPAQMLLDNPQINMPFCFCWANENWTRRWDGNEREILLGQTYSNQDARAFIRYLIPFFKDARYIKVDGRPMLHVYRPSDIKDCQAYLSIWREECERHGLRAPYVVATLTRGALSPYDYGMDAGVERVLYDWTDGAVGDICDRLQAYWPLDGGMLDYGEVADHYMNKALNPDFTLFRALVPVWDNTARYGAQALGLHGFTPRKMQTWLETLVAYSRAKLPSDRRFVVVNAWNEWAEGAHLEPDVRFGYGYLNTVGRALSDYQYESSDYVQIDPDLIVQVTLEPEVLIQLGRDPVAQRKMLQCLANSTVFGACRVQITDPDLAKSVAEFGIDCALAGSDEPDFKLVFKAPYLFGVEAIEHMLKMAIRFSGTVVSASVLNDPDYVHGDREQGHRPSGLVLAPAGPHHSHKACYSAACFRLLPEAGQPGTSAKVTTIIRLHQQGSPALLERALLSLLAQAGCHVQPLITLQDFSDAEVARLQASWTAMPWAPDCQPIIRRYASKAQSPDLRSLMMNDALKSVASGYVALLDYDDVVFPEAYRTLVGQLKTSGKAVSFGRVYSVYIDGESQKIYERQKRFVDGRGYQEFLWNNHAPIHSFVMDMDKLDLSNIKFYDFMKFMEDYYFTLQVFTEDNVDWDSLTTGVFIGDYTHWRGLARNTVAVSDEAATAAILSDDHYIRCEGRIKGLQNRLLAELKRKSSAQGEA
jgi:lipopolysaccharide biosynthesis protein